MNLTKHLKLYFSKKKLPIKMKSHLVIIFIERTGYIFPAVALRTQ